MRESENLGTVGFLYPVRLFEPDANAATRPAVARLAAKSTLAVC